MNKKIYALPFLLLSVVVSGCESDLLLEDLPASKIGGITFHISPADDESDMDTRGATLTRVSSLHYLLADGDGKVLTHCTGHLSEALDRLDIDGLKAGDYSIAFLGSSYKSDFAQIEQPENLDDRWLQNTVESLPVGGSYFIKKIDFTLSPELETRDYEVVLERAVSMIEIEFPGIPASVESLITSVTVTLDEGCHVYSSIKGDCTYTGEATITDHEVCNAFFNYTLSTLPATGPLSGTVNVKAATLSGDSISTSYRFSNFNVEAGKMNKLIINLRHPDIRTGFIHIRPQDYYDYDADLMLMEDESINVVHDITQRHFRLTEPLVVKTDHNQLRLQLYSAAPSGNVDIYANFPSLGIDSVRLVHFDRVEALLDMMVPMTFTQRETTYFDIKGKRVTIPKMDIPSNIEWIVKTDDPYLSKMSSLSLEKWNVSFHNWETIWPTMAIAPDLKCMRHAFVQMINLALTFDSEEFAEELASHRGEYIDSDKYITNEEILDRIHNSHDGCYGMGANNPSSGHNGWGGGCDAGCTSLIINQEYYAKMYPTENPDIPCNRERECFYHEHSHCLGFTHSGNMTYGGVWSNTIGAAMLRAHTAGKIFFYSPDFIESLPYKRSEAPKWATPRFIKM